MAKEIEYKFLIDEKNKDSLFGQIELITPFDIEQGYLNTDKEKTVRVRIQDNKSYITIKGIAVGASRNEYEYEIPLADAKEILEMCPQRIIKSRYKIPAEDGLYWEIDIFKGSNDGLIVAEIEVPNEGTFFSKPKWIGEDVTTNHKYTNSYLSLHSYKENNESKFPFK